MYHKPTAEPYRVPVPNFDRKMFAYLRRHRSQLFHTRTKIFFRVQDLWILLFRMVYNSSLCSRIFAEKSAVYCEELRLLLLGIMSLIIPISIIMVPNNDTPAKYMRKSTSQEKKHFPRALQDDRGEGDSRAFKRRHRKNWFIFQYVEKFYSICGYVLTLSGR